MKKTKKLIRFDWAMKRFFCHRVNVDILEGFLTELLGDAITIHRILESEGNKESDDDKHNRVDMLVENSKRNGNFRFAHRGYSEINRFNQDRNRRVKFEIKWLNIILGSISRKNLSKIVQAETNAPKCVVN